METTGQLRTETRPTSGLALIVICLGYFMVILDTTAVNVALPSIGRDLHSGVAGLQWVVDAYTLSFAALLLTGGTLAERLGCKRVFGIGLAVFAAASAACGLAPPCGCCWRRAWCRARAPRCWCRRPWCCCKRPTRPWPAEPAPSGRGAQSRASARPVARSSAACW
jgi:MFS family permease